MEITRRASDALRGIAILLIVLFHAFQPATEFGTGFLGRLGMAQIGVFIFLFVSGYGICRSYGLSKIDARRYFEKRFWRVVVPYWTVLTLTIVGLLLFLPVFFSMEWMKTAVVLNYLFISFAPYDILGGVGWFVTYILLWYVIYYLVSRLPMRDMGKILLMLIGVPAVVYFFSNDLARFLLALFPSIQVETLSFRGLYLPYAFAFPLGALASRVGRARLDFNFPVLSTAGKYSYWIYLLHMELLCSLAVFGVAGYCGGWNYAVTYNYADIGTEALSAGNYSGAVALADKAIARDDTYGRAYYIRGNAEYYLGDYAAALADYNTFIELEPSSAAAYGTRCYLKEMTGDYAGALADCDNAIALNPAQIEFYYYRGLVEGGLGQHALAADDFDKAIGLKPDYAQAYYNRGIAKALIQNYTGALADFTKVIELEPNNADAYNKRGAVKYVLGDYVGAKQDMDKAHVLNPVLLDYTAFTEAP